MEKKMENDMETRECIGIIRGFRVSGFRGSGLRAWGLWVEGFMN